MRQLYLLLLVLPAFCAAQTTSQTSFGKNRVQYHRQFDDWLHYESDHFDTYWYGDARNVAQAALQTAEYDFQSLQRLLEHQTTDRIEMLVFIDLTDLKQSNIGEEDIFQLKAGETKVIGNKIFAYFDGNHQHLRAQIREGIAGVLLNSMLFGSNLQEIVQNAVLLNLPGWYTNGLLSYCGQEWSPELDDQLRDLLQSGAYPDFDKLAKDHPRLAGHAFWYYIGLHFGKGTVSNLLYLTRINRSVDAGFLYVLGSGYKRTTDSMMAYFKRRYEEEAQYTLLPDAGGAVPFRNKRELPVYQVQISPDGRQLAWATNDIGRWKVWVLDRQNGRRKVVLRGGIRNAQQATDFNYPILRWHPDGRQLGILTERRDEIQLIVLNPETGEKTNNNLPNDYQRVSSMDFINPADLVFSASVKGYSDLFIYHTVARQTERLTQDFWDDLDARVAVLDGHKGVLFASNRAMDTLAPQKLDTILPIGNFDIYFYDLETRSPELLRITDSPLANERAPIALDSTYFAFLSDESGIVNRQAGFLKPYTAYYQTVFYLKNGAEAKGLHMGKTGEWPVEKALLKLAPEDSVRVNLDSTSIDSVRILPVILKKAITYNQSNYGRNLSGYSSGRSLQVETMLLNRKNVFFVSALEKQSFMPAWITRARIIGLNASGAETPKQQIDKPLRDLKTRPDTLDAKTNVELRDSVPPQEAGWQFQIPEYLISATPPQEAEVEKAEPKAGEPEQDAPLTEPLRPVRPMRKTFELGQPGALVRFNPSRIEPYRLKFRTDYVSTTMDNNLLFEGLDSYAGSPGGFNTPPPGILLRTNFKDLLEDYVIEAGFRLPTTFDGAEYYLWMDNKKRRIDKRTALYRKTTVNPIGNSPYQARTNTVLGQYELRYPFDDYFSVRAMGSLRQDKTVVLSTDNASLNAPDYMEQRASLRLSAVYDNTVDIDMNLRTGSRAKVYIEAVKRFELNTQPNWNFKFNSGFMTVVGIDARHYQRLDRRSVLALRLAGATTFGSERILYYLGGVDNWIFPQFNNNIPVPQDADFAYQTLAANLRGFKQNIRNGSSYALLNAELRIPLFKYFTNKPVVSNFWRNFQVVGFFDAGTAWQGRSPFVGDNPLNTIYLYNPPTVTVKVNYFRDPLVAGYGVGVRMLIFGIYVRADYAWGIETRVIQKPVFHLAMGTDF